MMDFLILPNGNYLIAGRPVAGNDTSILFEVAPTGRLVRRSLAIGALTPPGERRSAAWEPVRRFSVAASEQAYFGTNTLVDSLWSFDPRSGRVSAAAMPVPGYVPARLPRRTRTNADLYAWTQSFFNVSSVHTTGGFVLIPFVRGTLIDGDPVIYALRRENGSWMALSGGPPVLRAVDGLVIALENPLEDPVRLSVFRRKS